MTTTPSDADERHYREPWMSDEQWRCAKAAAELKRGFHHILELEPCGNGIQFYEPNEIATYDFDLMTRAVLLAHVNGVRIGASARSIKEEYEGNEYQVTKLILTVHPRQHGAEKMFERHPDVQDLIALADRSYRLSSIAPYEEALKEARDEIGAVARQTCDDPTTDVLEDGCCSACRCRALFTKIDNLLRGEGK